MRKISRKIAKLFSILWKIWVKGRVTQALINLSRRIFKLCPLLGWSGQEITARCLCGDGVSIVHWSTVPLAVERKLTSYPSFFHGRVQFACSKHSQKEAIFEIQVQNARFQRNTRAACGKTYIGQARAPCHNFCSSMIPLICLLQSPGPRPCCFWNAN